MSTWYGRNAECVLDPWYNSAHVVRYKLPFVDDDLMLLNELEENDARFIAFLDTHDEILASFRFEVGIHRCSPGYENPLVGFTSWAVDPYAQVHKGIINYCQLAVNQHERFKTNLRFITSIEERERIQTAVVQYLQYARDYVGAFTGSCATLESWHTKVVGAINDNVDIRVGNLAFVRADDLSSAASTRYTFGASASRIGPPKASWYRELYISRYPLWFVHELVEEDTARLKALVEVDKEFQAFHEANGVFFERFVSDVEQYQKDGITQHRFKYWGGPSDRSMLFKGLVNYCRFAVKQHSCWKNNARYIASHMAAMRCKTEISRCLGNARIYTEPYCSNCHELRFWLRQVMDAQAEAIDLGPTLINENGE